MSETSGSNFRSQLIAAGVGGLVVGVLGLILAGFVTWTLWSGWAADNTRNASVIEVAQEQRDTMAAGQETATRTVARLEGAVAVGRALVELDRRNFGVAQKQIEQAAVLLDGVGPDAQTGVPPQIVAEQAARLRTVKIEVSDDTGDQRNQLIAVFELLTTK